MEFLPRILIVDDDLIWREQLQLILEDQCSTVEADTLDKGLQLIHDSFFDIVILDLNFKEDLRSGLEVFKAIHAADMGTDILVISGETDVQKIVKVINSGVKRFLHKPVEVSEIRNSISDILEERKNRKKALSYIGHSNELNPLLGSSPKILKVRSDIERIVRNDTKDILILGESGTGKEVVARHISLMNAGTNRSFLPIHCGAISETLFESELFGHIKGSFTDAKSDRAGVFETVRGGYVFLDEIGEMPLAQQAKLLRVLQERAIRRIGSNEEKQVNFRTISATNRDIVLEIQEGRFREDLYYRVAKEQIVLPPLRDRKEDIPELVEYFLEANKKINKKGISPEAMVMLQKYHWPGNVRELMSVVDSLYSRVPDDVIRDKHICQVIPESISSITKSSNNKTLRLYSSAIARERRKFEDALAKVDGSRDKAAKLLKMSRATFFRKAKELGITKDRSSRKSIESNF